MVTNLHVYQYGMLSVLGQVNSAYTDFLPVFDIVSREHLVCKFRPICVGEPLVTFIHNFLTGCKQHVP